MIKWISAFLLFLLSIFIIGILYLSTIGIETNSFNDLIRNKLKNYNEDIDLKFRKAKLLLDIKSLNLKIKLIKPKVESQKKEINFYNISSVISIKSYLANEFAIKNIKIKTNKVELPEFIKFIRSTYPSPFIFVLNNSIKKGKIEGETELFFNKKGELIENYEIVGSISNLGANIIDKHRLENINSNFKIKKDFFKFDIKSFRLHEIYFDSTNISIKKNNNDLDISVISKNLGKVENVDKFLSNFNYTVPYNNINFSNLDFSLNNKIDFKLKKFVRLKDFKMEGSGLINNLLLTSDDFEKNSKYIEIDKNLKLQNNKINYKYNNKKLKFETSGKINFKDEFENYKADIVYDYKKDSKIFNADFELNNPSISFENLNYYKSAEKEANLKINVVFDKKKKIIENLEYNESKNIILIKNLELNNKYRILDFNSISISTLKNNNFNNDFKIFKKNKKINISGKKYDATYFFKTLNKDDDSKILSKKFKGEINFKIDEIISKNDSMFDFMGKGQLNSGKVQKLNAKANFSDNEFLDISIIPTNSNKKKLTIYSDRAKPFVDDFKFIKGFTEGTLEYSSIYDDKISKNNLKINDFKVKDVPVLAKLLSLASLQGIADLLTGEGIRFNEFEIDFNSKGKLVNIDEIYAIGPAISILMSGYIEKDKLVSLRGTLVPATTINKAIGSLPLIGKILVGNKTGEGVFGVSFKIKGPPKKLKTTVNPIKTLTPRFITRTLEKIKKSN